MIFRTFVIGGFLVAVGVLLLGPEALAASTGMVMMIDASTLEQGKIIDFPEARFQLQLPKGVATEEFSVRLDATVLPKSRRHASLVSSVVEIGVVEQDHVELRKLPELRFQFEAKGSGNVVIHFWDQSREVWKPLPTRVDGEVAMAPFPLKYGKVAAFELRVPVVHAQFEPEDQTRSVRVQTKRKDFEIRVPKNSGTASSLHVELKTDVETEANEQQQHHLQRISPVFSFDVDAEGFSASQMLELRVHYKQSDEFSKQIFFWDQRRSAWFALPSDDRPLAGVVVARTSLRYAKIALFSDASARSIGQASWYRSRRTPMAAANNDYPLGSMLEVTNLDNQQSVIVKVVSSGPYVPGRIIDLTLDAFEVIADPYADGVIRVHLEEK